MNTWFAISWSIVFAVIAGCAPKSVSIPKGGDSGGKVAVGETLVQFSLLAALAADDYSGGAPLRDVLTSGDFGVGTFDRLDGEMIVLDGKIYQALADGTVREADLRGTTPFAAVTFFEEDGRIDDFSAATLEHLDQQLDRRLPRRNWPYAIRIDGQFTEVTVRSVPEQTPPYRPLVEVVKEQPTWEHRNINGTLVGLRCPAWMGTLNVSGYHWHFLSDDRDIGGHVLECNLDRGKLVYDECSSVLIRLPNSQEFANFDMDDVSQGDVDRIERQRGRE
ncbi:MAG: acetolactate decarboxylase [Pirellulales bacterium]